MHTGQVSNFEGLAQFILWFVPYSYLDYLPQLSSVWRTTQGTSGRFLFFMYVIVKAIGEENCCVDTDCEHGNRHVCCNGHVCCTKIVVTCTWSFGRVCCHQRLASHWSENTFWPCIDDGFGQWCARLFSGSGGVFSPLSLCCVQIAVWDSVPSIRFLQSRQDQKRQRIRKYYREKAISNNGSGKLRSKMTQLLKSGVFIRECNCSCWWMVYCSSLLLGVFFIPSVLTVSLHASFLCTIKTAENNASVYGCINIIII